MRLTRTISSTARRSLSKHMSSLAPGHILSGARWNYRIKEAVEGDNTQISTGFKAEIIHENSLGSPQCAFIKAASPSDATSVENLERERQSYLLPGVASAACFRKLYDVFDNSMDGTGMYLALEWLDTTLAEFYRAGKPKMREYRPRISSFLASKLGELSLKWVIWDLCFRPVTVSKPSHILCALLKSSWARRALSHRRFGQLPQCYFVGSNLGFWASDTLKAAVKSAGRMSLEEPEMQAISPLDVELQGIRMPEQLRDLLRLMLIVDPNKRPSASSVLTSREFLAFEKLNGI